MQRAGTPRRRGRDGAGRRGRRGLCVRVQQRRASRSRTCRRAAGAPWWLQVYVTARPRATRACSARAVDAGARGGRADRGHPGRRHASTTGDTRSGTSPETACMPTNLGRGSAHPRRRRPPTWPRRRRVAGEPTGLPVVVKGVLRADDAAVAVDAGAAAVWVSNHGGRQLDRAAAPRPPCRTVVAEVGDGGRGVRRRGSPQRPRRAGGARARRAGGLPGPAGRLERSPSAAPTAVARLLATTRASELGRGDAAGRLRVVLDVRRSLPARPGVRSADLLNRDRASGTDLTPAGTAA